MEKRKTNLKFILIAIPVVALIAAGVLWAKQYYDYRYALEDCYYTVVPLDYDITPVRLYNDDGKFIELVTYYNLTCYNAEGESRELEGRVRINMHDLYPPGTYLEFSASKQFVIGQRALDEKDIPEKALEKIKETYAPSSASTLAEYAEEKTRQLSLKNTPSVSVFCVADDNTLIYTYIYSDDAKESAGDMIELLDPVYKSQFRTDKLTFPELTAIFLEIKLENGTVIYSQKYNRKVEFSYENE